MQGSCQSTFESVYCRIRLADQQSVQLEPSFVRLAGEKIGPENRRPGQARKRMLAGNVKSTTAQWQHRSLSGYYHFQLPFHCLHCGGPDLPRAETVSLSDASTGRL